VQVLEDGIVQAAFFVNHPPSREISSLLSIQGFRLFSFQDSDIEDVRAEFRCYEPYTIAAHTYPLQTSAISTVSVSTILVCRPDLPRKIVERISHALIMDVSRPNSVLKQSQANVRLSDVLGQVDSPYVYLHPGVSDALKRVPMRVKARRWLEWIKWGLGLSLSIAVFVISCLRLWRVRVVYFLINVINRGSVWLRKMLRIQRAPVWLGNMSWPRKLLKTLSLHGMTWRICRAFSALAVVWLAGAAAMYGWEEDTNVAFHDLREASLSVLLYLFSGAEGRVPVSGGGVGVLFAMLIMGAIIGAYVTGEFASQIIRRIRGGYRRTKNMAKHSILIVGWNSGAERVIDEFLSSFEAGIAERSVTVLAQKDVDEAIQTEYLKQGVTFLCGSCVDKRTLNYVGAPGCKCVVVLADETAADPDGQTIQTVLELKSLFREKLSESDSHPQICAEVLDSSRMGIVDDAGADSIVCHERFGFALLAQAALTPRLIEVYRDLLMYSDDTCEIYMLSSEDSGRGSDFPNGLWDRQFEGREFYEATSAVREVSERGNPMILIGVQREGEIYLAPKEKLTLQMGDSLIVLAWKRPSLR